MESLRWRSFWRFSLAAICAARSSPPRFRAAAADARRRVSRSCTCLRASAAAWCRCARLRSASSSVGLGLGFSDGGGRCGAGGRRRGGGLAAGSGCEGGVRTRPAAEVRYVFASLICLKRSVASSTFVGLRSGWYMRASLRKAFLWRRRRPCRATPGPSGASCARTSPSCHAVPALRGYSGSNQASGRRRRAELPLAWQAFGAAQGRVAAAPRRRAPSDGQNRWLVRLIDRWRGPGPATGREGRSTPAAPASAWQFARGRHASPARPAGLGTRLDGTESRLRGNPTSKTLLPREAHWQRQAV